jgi:hypothetical protein
MKIFILLSSILISSRVAAQIPEDALRYSFFPQNGTARNLAIGGAMGSLGGDINATYVNPAGLGFYKTGEFVITPGFFLNNNKASYRESNTQSKKNALGFGTSGLVMGFPNRYNNNNNAISVALTQTANFNNTIQYKGLNNYSSFSEQFAEEFAKSGKSIDYVLNTNSIFPYTSAPALYTYLIDTVKVNGVYQVKGAPEFILDAGQAIKQEMNKITSGGITEFALGFAHNHQGKWFFGGTIGMPYTTYTSNMTFKESDTSSNTSNHFKAFDYNDTYKTTGWGINAKLGLIYRPQEYIRLGVAIHTPTFNSFADTRKTTLNTQLENPVGNFSVSSLTFTNNVEGQSKYYQSGAWKIIGSASYVFRELENVKKQRAFITADVEYITHGGSRFSSNNDSPTQEEKNYYTTLNKVVKDQYKGALNLRVGGELKFNTLMGRLGFAYYSNPYKIAELKANRMLLSGGLGYRNKGVFFDLTYVHNISKDVDFAYRLQDRANTYASLKQTRGNIIATLGFKF